MNKLRCLLFDIINGVRSGIPLCCIEYFVRTPLMAMIIQNEYNPLIQYQRCMSCRSSERIVEIRHNGCTAHWLIPPPGEEELNSNDLW